MKNNTGIRQTTLTAVIKLYEKIFGENITILTKDMVKKLFKRTAPSKEPSVYRVPGCGYNIFFIEKDSSISCMSISNS
jgi:hypothetical protein